MHMILQLELGLKQKLCKFDQVTMMKIPSFMKLYMMSKNKVKNSIKKQ